MSRFGFNINWKNSPEQILELGERYLKTGLYQAIEVTYYENMEGIDTFAYNQAVRTLVERYHPQVLVHVSAFNLSEENAVIRNAIFSEIENCMKYTASLGGKEVIIHGGFLSSGMHVPILHEDHSRPSREETYEKAWKLTVKMLKRVCILAKEYGMTLYTENLNQDHLTTDSRALNRLLDDVNMDNLKIVFDIGHCSQNGYNIVDDVLEAGTRLKHLHLHDNFGKDNGHLPIGDGTIDFKAFAQALKQIGYDGLYMLELFRCDEENLRYSRERLLECIK